MKRSVFCLTLIFLLLLSACGVTHAPSTAVAAAQALIEADNTPIAEPDPTPEPTPAETPEPTATPEPTDTPESANTTEPTEEPASTPPTAYDYVLNTHTMKFHLPDCPSVDQMKDSNKEYFSGTREEIIAMGYDPCGNCHP